MTQRPGQLLPASKPPGRPKKRKAHPARRARRWSGIVSLIAFLGIGSGLALRAAASSGGATVAATSTQGSTGSATRAVTPSAAATPALPTSNSSRASTTVHTTTHGS